MKKITAKSTKFAKTAATASPGGPAVDLARKAPAKKPAAKTTSTKITAQFDVGFGNTLYIRGEGPGLSWDRGLAMDCVADDEWTITISDATVPVVFKFLLNDITWCVGNDYVVEPGGSIAVVPSF
jgi:hypothetical protein